MEHGEIDKISKELEDILEMAEEDKHVWKGPDAAMLNALSQAAAERSEKMESQRLLMADEPGVQAKDAAWKPANTAREAAEEFADTAKKTSDAAWETAKKPADRVRGAEEKSLDAARKAVTKSADTARETAEKSADEELQTPKIRREFGPAAAKTRWEPKDSVPPALPDTEENDEPEEERGRNGRGLSLNIIRPSDGLIAAFFVPVIIMIIIFVQRGIFPFGEESFLRTDMYHQYAPFFSEFQHKLTHGGSLFYSWDVGMGVNFSALYAYYLASPMNWLLAFCPKSLIIEFMSYMIVLKIGLSGLSFAWYLRKHNHTRDFGVAFFGIFYALSGYMAAYSWNIMWLDCIILFPIIMLGLERLVKEKKPFLYCFALGLSILSNYYISIMICIFMALYFVVLLIMEKRQRFIGYLGDAARFSVYSLAAGGLAAAVLLPEIYALQMTASTEHISFPKDYLKTYFSIFDMLARHIGNVGTEIGLDHWPNIYCGVAVFMFFLLYLGCKKIAAKEKVVYSGLLLFFMASFSIDMLNFIWHGFHYPNSLPCRQSFIYIALALLVCYRAYMHLKDIPWRHVVFAFWGSVAFVLLAQKMVTEKHFQSIAFYVAILFLAAYAGLIWMWKRRKSSLVALAALGVVAVEAAVNTTVTSVTTTSRTSYVQDNGEVEKLLAAPPLSPITEFYRVEKVQRKTKNDGAFMNFPSVSLFSSTANSDLSKFFKRLGCESSTNAYSITGSTPLVDSLFSVKYGLYSQEPGDTGLLTKAGQEGHTYLYENAYTLPLAFVVSPDLEDNWQTDLGNPAEVQNDLSSVIGALPVMEEVYGEITGTSFRFTPEQSGDYYVYVNEKKIEKVTVTSGSDVKTFDNVNRGYFLELGYVPAGQEVVLQSSEGEYDLVASAYRFSPEGLKTVYQILNQSPFQLTSWTDTDLAGSVQSEKAGVLYTSIPYDKGWTVCIDGEEKETGKIFDTFLSVEAPAGNHTVTFSYMPEGLVTGGWITVGSLLFLALAVGFQLLRNRKRERQSAEETDKEIGMS